MLQCVSLSYPSFSRFFILKYTKATFSSLRSVVLHVLLDNGTKLCESKETHCIYVIRYKREERGERLLRVA